MLTYGAPTGERHPVNTHIPTITGHAKIGSRLVATHGRWTTAPTTYKYQWNICNKNAQHCRVIRGATKSGLRIKHSTVGIA